jgi:hypothetical protein
MDFFSYMHIRIYSHILCNYCRPTHLVQTLPPTQHQPTQKKNNDNKIFSFQIVELFQLDRNIDLKKLDTCKMCLKTDIYIHTHTCRGGGAGRLPPVGNVTTSGENEAYLICFISLINLVVLPPCSFEQFCNFSEINNLYVIADKSEGLLLGAL